MSRQGASEQQTYDDGEGLETSPLMSPTQSLLIPPRGACYLPYVAAESRVPQDCESELKVEGAHGWTNERTQACCVSAGGSGMRGKGFGGSTSTNQDLHTTPSKDWALHVCLAAKTGVKRAESATVCKYAAGDLVLSRVVSGGAASLQTNLELSLSDNRGEWEKSMPCSRKLFLFV